MMKKILINTGAALLIGAIAISVLIPALRGTQDPGREQMQEIRTFQRERERGNLRNERLLVFLAGGFGGAGLACLVVALTLRGRNEEL